MNIYKSRILWHVLLHFPNCIRQLSPEVFVVKVCDRMPQMHNFQLLCPLLDGLNIIELRKKSTCEHHQGPDVVSSLNTQQAGGAIQGDTSLYQELKLL